MNFSETYPAGTMLGFEALLGEAPEECSVTAPGVPALLCRKPCNPSGVHVTVRPGTERRGADFGGGILGRVRGGGGGELRSAARRRGPAASSR